MAIDLPVPHLLFLGDITNPLDAKTAMGIRDWRPEHCVGQWRLPGCTVDLGLPTMTPASAAMAGAQSVLMGVAPAGGVLCPSWIRDFHRQISKLHGIEWLFCLRGSYQSMEDNDIDQLNNRERFGSK